MPAKALKETVLALGLIAFGLICLPALVYVVGQQILGDYEDGLGGFYEAIAANLASGHFYAWILVLSPYLTIQLLRLAFRLRRRRKPVT